MIGLRLQTRVQRSALHVSQKTMASELARSIFRARCRNSTSPVTFILGRHDHRTWAPLAERYLKQLDAPCKRLFWLEHSAHNGPFEEPVLFRQYLLDAIRNSRSLTGEQTGSIGGYDPNNTELRKEGGDDSCCVGTPG